MDSQNFVIIPEGKICDYIDGTFRKDTPEEYVRQTIEKRLVDEHRYSKFQICVEYSVKMGSSNKRADIVIFDKNLDAIQHTQDKVKIIIECKREAIKATDSKDGIDQLKSYMSVCPNCEWGMWTNSFDKFVFRKVQNDKGEFIFEEYNDIPSAEENISEIDKPTRDNLKNASDDNLLFVFRTCHNYIYANDGLQKQPAFFELLKVIFCKIEDERSIQSELEFYSTSKEKNDPDGQLNVKKRIAKIFNRVKDKYGKIFAKDDEIKLNKRSLAKVVSELQKYDLLHTNIDIKGKAYEEIVGANLRGDRGEFFTPRNIMKMVVEMINPQPNEKVLDSSCGTGGFLVMAMNHVIEILEQKYLKRFGKSHGIWDKQFQELISETAQNNFFGFDLNPDLVKATKMNMVMNNDGSGNILQTNSLLPPHEWSEDFKAHLANALKIDISDLRNHNTINYFNVIVTNPPFGSKIPIDDESILKQYELAHVWKLDKSSSNWTMTDKLQPSVPPEILFVERCTQFLVDGGRMGIVLPDSILGSPGLGYIREWLIQNHKIIASIDLHADTFQPRNGTQTSVLILQKYSQEEKINIKLAKLIDYDIFMAMVEKVGHDKRGNTIYKRDAEGNEILVDNYKIIDDETLEVAKAFNEWKKKLNFDVKLIKCCTVKLSEVIARGKRLEASVFDVEAMQARQIINGKNIIDLASSYVCGRFKRIWVDKSDLPIYQPSAITEINPKPDGYLSSITDTDIDDLRVHRGQILMTCSGTIGKVAYVSKTLDNKIFSHDLLRINAKNEVDAGYIYTYFKSKIGNKLLLTSRYGAVITHIEPEHLANVPIPDASIELKQKIHSLIVKSYELRDESNDLIDEATKLLIDELKLSAITPPLRDDLTPHIMYQLSTRLLII